MGMIILKLDLIEVTGTVRNKEINVPSDIKENFRKDILNLEKRENNP